MAREAIFIGYRRDDTADVAGRIFDAMALRFGRERIFKDVDNIGPGVHFGEYVRSVLPRCRVALFLIGPNWIDSADEGGERRLDDTNDWVRIEIETALATPNLLAVPVLVNGARMPRANELPASLRPLLHRNAAVIRRDPDFHDDVERLAAALRASVSTGVLDLSKLGGASAPAPRARAPSRTPLLIAAAMALLAGGYAASRFLSLDFTSPSEQQATIEEPAPTDASAESDTAPPPARAETGAAAQAPPAPADRRPDVTPQQATSQLSPPQPARTSNTPPDSEFASADPAAIELAVWQGALTANTVDAYRDYLQQYPYGRFRVQAEQNVERLHQRSNATFIGRWRLTERLQTMAGLTRPCRRYIEIISIGSEIVQKEYDGDAPTEADRFLIVTATDALIRYRRIPGASDSYILSGSGLQSEYGVHPFIRRCNYERAG